MTDFRISSNAGKWFLLVIAGLLHSQVAVAQLPQIKRFIPANQVKSSLISELTGAVSGALSGKWLALGYPDAKVADKTKAGLVLLVNPDTGSLIRVIRETAPDTEARLGSSCAISGNLLAVGAPTYQGGRGAVFVFDLNTGKQLLRIVNDVNDPNALGTSVAIHGDILAAGAPDSNAAGGMDQAGKVRLYRISTGAMLGTLGGSSPVQVGDTFGTSLAVQGRQIAVGAPTATSGAQLNAGAAYLFDLETFALQSRLQASDPTLGARYGRAIAFTRQSLAVTASTGLYVIDARSFSQTLLIAKPLNVFSFGHALACLGMTAYVGVGLDNDDSEIRSFDLLTGDPLETWRTAPLTLGAGYPLLVDYQRVVTGSFIEATGPGLVTYGAIYTRSFPVSREPLQSLAIVKPQLSPIGVGKLIDVPQLTCRGTGDAALLSRFQNPQPGFAKGAYLAIDGMGNYTVPLTIAGTGIAIAQVGGGGSLGCSDITQIRMNHPSQTAFLGMSKSTAGNLPFIGIITSSVERFSVRRAGLDAVGAGSGKIAAFLDLAQSSGTGLDADVATRVRLQTGVDGITKKSDSAVLLISTTMPAVQNTLSSAKENQQEPGGGGVLLGEIKPQVTFSPSLACFIAFRQSATAENQAAYSIDRTGTATRWLTKGALSPAGNVRTILGISANANNDRMLRFTTEGSGITAANNEMFVSESGLQIRKGSAYPASPAGMKWKRFLGFYPARASSLIVHGAIQGPKVTAANDGVVTLFADGNAPLTLLREGDLLPGGGGARIGTILRVDARPGDPSGSYLILATLAGAPADSNLVMLSGRSALGNNVTLTARFPFTMLRKGQWTLRPAGYNGKLTSISLPGKNTNSAGFAGTGHLHWQGGEGKAVMRLDWNGKEAEIVRAQW